MHSRPWGAFFFYLPASNVFLNALTNMPISFILNSWFGHRLVTNQQRKTWCLFSLWQREYGFPSTPLWLRRPPEPSLRSEPGSEMSHPRVIFSTFFRLPTDVFFLFFSGISLRTQQTGHISHTSMAGINKVVLFSIFCDIASLAVLWNTEAC